MTIASRQAANCRRDLLFQTKTGLIESGASLWTTVLKSTFESGLRRSPIAPQATMFACLALVLTTQAAYSQQIKDFRSDIRIAANGNLEVTENITMSFDKASERHHFYRTIPVIYDRGKSAHKIDVNVRNVSVDDGKPVPWSSWAAGRELYVRVGDEVEQFDGTRRFKIAYEVHKGVDFVSGAPQLYMNVTGDRWPFAIDSAEIVVAPPKGTDLSRVTKSAELFGTTHESSATPVKVGIGTDDGAGAVTVRASNIQPGQGLLVHLGMPRGTVVPPSVLQEVVWHLQNSYQVFVLPVATIIFLCAWWFFYGRDPQSAPKDKNSWRPPEGLTPAEVGTLIDERCDLTDVVSTVIDLAVRGYIKIRVVPFNGFLYLTNRDYEFTLLKSPRDRELKPHEQLFLTLLFGMSTTTYVSALRGQFADYLPYLKRRVYTSLVTGGYFARDPDVDRKNFLSVGAAVITVGVALLLASTYNIGGTSTALGTIASGIVLLFAANAMPKKTTDGVRSVEQIKTFRNFLVFGDKNDLETVAREEPAEFDRFLPHAIVLGVSDHWARLFKDAVSSYPQWYEIDKELLTEGFSSLQFVTELGEGLHVINRALTDLDRVNAIGVDDRSLVGGNVGYPP